MTPQQLDDRLLKYLEDRVKSAQETLQKYRSQRACCRMMNSSLIKETVGHANVNDFDLEQHRVGKYDSTYHCKTCGRCVYSTES